MRSWSAAAKPASAAKLGWTAGPGNNFHRRSEHGRCCRWARCSASCGDRRRDVRAQQPASAPSDAGLPSKAASDGGSPRIRLRHAHAVELAGFLSAPDEDEQGPLTGWEKVVRGVRFIVAGLIWALTWVVPITFMILMAWGCENDARRFGHRVATHYADNGEDTAAAIATADRSAAGNRAVSFARGALVLVSVAIPLALIASTLVGGSGPLGVNVPEELAALLALALVIGVSAAAVRG